MTKKIQIILLSILFVPLMASMAVAAERLEAGQTIPENIALIDQHGEEKDLGSLIGEAGSVLVFFRSADWCPYCKVQLIDLRDNRAQFEKEDFSIIGISYDAPETLMKFEKEHQPGFTLLSDTGSETIKAFGLFDDSKPEGSFGYGIPYPAVYVVDSKGMITAVLSEESYKERPQVEAIMAEVYKARGKTK